MLGINFYPSPQVDWDAPPAPARGMVP
jgi:hypothetical protein